MNSWIWIIDYGGRDEPVRVIIAARDRLGGICNTLGYLAINLTAHSWPWWVGLHPGGRFNLGTALVNASQTLIDIADRHTTELAAVPATGDLAAALKRHHLIIDWEDE